MKKILIFIAAGGLFVPPALAVKKCLQLDGWADGTDLSFVGSDFRVSFGPNGYMDSSGGYEIRGTGRCFATNATYPTISANLSGAGYGAYCWCRVLEPVLTDWFYQGVVVEETPESCSAECVGYCGYMTMHQDWTSSLIRAKLGQ